MLFRIFLLLLCFLGSCAKPEPESNMASLIGATVIKKHAEIFHKNRGIFPVISGTPVVNEEIQSFFSFFKVCERTKLEIVLDSIGIEKWLSQLDEKSASFILKIINSCK